MLLAPFLRSIRSRSAAQANTGYPLTLPLFRDGKFSVDFTTPITILSGENGTGKSTLLETIAENCGFNLSGGNHNHTLEQSNDIADLTRQLTFSWSKRVRNGFFLRAESLFNFASYLDGIAEDAGDIAFDGYGGKSLHKQSHGEAFISVLQNRLVGQGIFILDEPEAALSPQRQLQLLSLLHQAHKKQEAQIIMATHSPILMSYPWARILEITDGNICEKPYRETKNFNLYSRFMASPQRFHNELFSD